MLVAGSAARATAMVATMVGVVVLLAATAAVDAPAHFRGAAREDTPHGPVVGGAQVLPVGTGVVRPMLTEQLCEIESHEDVRS